MKSPLTRWPGVLCLAAACGPPVAAPAPSDPAVGCYVIQRRSHVTGDSLELLFPYFFGLTRSKTDSARRVMLPRSELIGRAGHWSWRTESGWITVTVVTESEGFQLDLQTHGEAWNGRLHAWSAEETGDWLVAGTRPPCPADLVPAAQAPFAAGRHGPYHSPDRSPAMAPSG